MDRYGIDRGLVSSLNSVFYRNTHEGNKELKETVKQSRNRLLPLATVNPTYAEWERDMDEALLDWRWKGVYLVPSHHRYQLSDQIGQSVLQRIAQCDVPLVLPQRLEDRRQQHWMDQTVDLSFDQVATALKPFPTLRVILLNWSGLNGNKILEAGLADRVLIDITRLSVVMQKNIPKLIDLLGVGAIGFGSHIPMAYPGPALIRLQMLDYLSKPDRERIAWRNAAAFLGVDMNVK